MSAIWVIVSDADTKSIEISSSLKDDRGLHSWGDGRIALAGSSSHFLPEDRFDKQPLWTPDRSACLVADVRLDNRADLVRELGLTQPAELADSAVLLAAWQRWGQSCVDRLLGAFAFAVWTPSRQELFAARDAVGERPLFYCRANHLFVLASSPGSLFSHAHLQPQLQQPAIAAWLASLDLPRDATLFDGIQRLPAGHFLRLTPGALEVRQYWHPANARPTRFKRDEEYAEALVEILDRATEARLRSTTPVGSFLSAGLDSSSVTASAARLLAARGQGLTAFTSVPRPEFRGQSQPGQIACEREGAAAVARLYPNIQHLLVDSTGYPLLPTMQRWADALDEPPPNLANLLWFTAILDRARERGIGVLLEGASGNGTISWNSWSIFGHLLQQGRLVDVVRAARDIRNRGAISFKTAARLSLRPFLPHRINRLMVRGRNREGLADCLIHPALIARYGLRQRIFDTFFPPARSITQEQSALFESVDAGPFHAATEQLTGVELRDPTADKRVFEFCFSIPPEQSIVGNHTRSLIRRAMKDRLPDSVRLSYLRGRQSSDWFLPMTEALPELHHELDLLAESPAAREALDLPAMRALLESWPQSDFHTERVHVRWHFWLTRAFSMGYFLRTHDPALTASAAAPSRAPAGLI